MNTLEEFLRYNRWADERVFKVCERADAALLSVEAAGTNGTVLSTLAHMVSVSEAFAAITWGAVRLDSSAGRQFMVGPAGLVDGYFDHDLQWYGARQAFLDDAFLDIAGGLDDAAREQPVFIPWMGFEMQVQQALMQAFVHCSHHRSQVFSALGAQAVKVPDLDYIVMLAKERKTA